MELLEDFGESDIGFVFHIGMVVLVGAGCGIKVELGIAEVVLGSAVVELDIVVG